MRFTDFEDIYAIYVDRYGDFKTSETTKKMWFEKLNHLDLSEFTETLAHLVGKEERAFGWGRVLEKHKLLYPPSKPREKHDDEKEAQWKAQARAGSIEGRQKALDRFWRKMANPHKEEGWKNDAIKDIVMIFDKEEARNLARNCFHMFPELKRFLDEEGNAAYENKARLQANGF